MNKDHMTTITKVIKFVNLQMKKIQLQLINHLHIQKIYFIQETFITRAQVSAAPLCTISIN